jgi:hypothetical protein
VLQISTAKVIGVTEDLLNRSRELRARSRILLEKRRKLLERLNELHQQCGELSVLATLDRYLAKRLREKPSTRIYKATENAAGTGPPTIGVPPP